MQMQEEIIEKEPPGVNTFHKVLLGGNSLPVVRCLPQVKKYSHLYQNGVSHLLPRLTLKVHTDIEECYNLWDAFSPKKSLFDLWDFRYAWHEGYSGKAYFYTIYENKKPLATLPLWFDYEEKRFEWFGTEWMEDNTFNVKDLALLDVLLAVMPYPVRLNTLMDIDLKELEKYAKVELDDPKNIKDISATSSIDEVLFTYTKKHRYNLKADYKKIKTLNPHVTVNTSTTAKDLEELISLNKRRFDGVQKEESAFSDEGEVMAFRNIVKNAGVYKVKFIKVHYQGALIATDMVAIYNNIYYTLRGGADVLKYPGLGNYMTYLDFQDAISSGARILDCLQEDNGWKHRYFDQQPVYLLKK